MHIDTKKKIFALIAILIPLSNELIRTFIRPVYGKKEYGIISDILGWLPNFLAAPSIIALGMLILMAAEDYGKNYISKNRKLKILTAISTITLIGLLVHEVTQKGTGLYYDLNDIYATIAGCVTGFIFYYFLQIKNSL